MLILEDGTGLTNSNSYASVAAFVAFWTDRDDAAADALTAAISAALIRATDYIDSNYVFRSVRLSDTQALENPRYEQDGLNPLLVKATITLARDLLTIDPNTPLESRDLISKTVSVGGAVSTSKTYANERNDRFEHITRILKSVAAPRTGCSGGGTMRLSR